MQCAYVRTLLNHTLQWRQTTKWPTCNTRSRPSLSEIARYNWPHSFSCAARGCKCQISCHNKRYIQLSQSRPRTSEVQTRHEFWNLYVTMLWSYHVVGSFACKHGGNRCSLLWQKHQNSRKISMDRLIKMYEKMSVSNIIHVSYIRVIPAQLKQGCTPYVMDFFLIKYTCRYHWN